MGTALVAAEALQKPVVQLPLPLPLPSFRFRIPKLPTLGTARLQRGGMPCSLEARQVLFKEREYPDGTTPYQFLEFNLYDITVTI